MRAFVLLLTLILAGAMLSLADAKPPAIQEDPDKIAIENDFVRVVFDGKTPDLRVFSANASDTANATFVYRFVDLVEYRDLDMSGGPSANEVVARLDLAGASGWNVTHTGGDAGAQLNFSLSGPVALGKDLGLPVPNVTNVSLPIERNANVSLVFTLRDGASTSGNTTIPASALAYELIVDPWPFVNADLDRLALDVEVVGAVETAEQNATILANDTDVGALAWSPTARGNTSAGSALDVPVRVATTDARANTTATALSFTYDAPGLASLAHDAAIGVLATPEALEPGSTSESTASGRAVPAPGLLLAAVALGAAVVLRGRKA